MDVLKGRPPADATPASAPRPGPLPLFENRKRCLLDSSDFHLASGWKRLSSRPLLHTSLPPPRSSYLCDTGDNQRKYVRGSRTSHSEVGNLCVKLISSSKGCCNLGGASSAPPWQVARENENSYSQPSRSQGDSFGGRAGMSIP